MRIEPTLDIVVNGDRGMLRGIDVAVEASCLVSAVSLMFSTLDALAALDRPIGRASTDRSVFLKWVERYIRPAESLGCSAMDLYAARCGVLHTYSAESDLQREGKAQRLIYQWGEGPPADASVSLPKDAIVITVEALREAVRNAAHEFLIEAEMDPQTKSRVANHLPSLLCYAPWPRMEVTIAA
jgi:hypothetical protein